MADAQDSVFVIAEVGNNHNGCVRRALRLVKAAKNAGADAVKFQMRDLKNLYRESAATIQGEDLGVEYTKDLLNRVELGFEDHQILAGECEKLGIEYMCTPWDQYSLKNVLSLGVTRIKIASADFDNLELLEAALATKLPVILSTGMASDREIQNRVAWLNCRTTAYTMLHCVSTYPAPFQDIQLNYLKRLSKYVDSVGYSSHERGIAVSIAAVALGARTIEKHLTEDRDLEGPDHNASILPDELALLVQSIRELELALTPTVVVDKKISQGAKLNKDSLGKSIVSARDIEAGKVIERLDLDVKSPGNGLSPALISSLIGAQILVSKEKGEFLFSADFNSKSSKFDAGVLSSTNWGLPVRPHDCGVVLDIFDPPVAEFHLSYSDIGKQLKPDDASKFTGKSITVHTPELFDNGELLNLASMDEAYRRRSIDNLKKTVDYAHALAESINFSEQIPLITNVGGWSVHEFLQEDCKDGLYQQLSDSLGRIDFGNTKLLAQNMAPFPWHMGGQRFQNLFLCPEEIVRMSKSLGISMCIDTAHLGMFCNYSNRDFWSSLTTTMEVCSHLHIGDFYGTNGEGILLGHGELPLTNITDFIFKHSRMTWIIETWQGHHNNGEGFARELELLKRTYHRSELNNV